MRTLQSSLLLLTAISFPAGCLAAEAHSPSVDVLGSYFPAWMACIIIGLVLTIIARLLLIGLGIHAHLRPRPLVYLGLLILFTLGVWLIFFKN